MNRKVREISEKEYESVRRGGGRWWWWWWTSWHASASLSWQFKAYRTFHPSWRKWSDLKWWSWAVMSAVGLHWRLSDSPPCAPAKINQAETLHLPHLNRKYVSYIRQEPSCVDMKSWKNISYNLLICWAISDSERDTTALYDSSIHQLTSFPAGKDATFHRVFFIYFLVWHNWLLCTDGSMPFFLLISPYELPFLKARRWTHRNRRMSKNIVELHLDRKLRVWGEKGAASDVGFHCTTLGGIHCGNGTQFRLYRFICLFHLFFFLSSSFYSTYLKYFVLFRLQSWSSKALLQDRTSSYFQNFERMSMRSRKDRTRK